MKLYVGNLPYSASETDIETWLTEKGITADTISLVRDRFSGDSRGFAFVEINDASEAESMIVNCHGKDFQGRSLVVNEARPKMPPVSAGFPSEHEQRRGRGSGSRRGRGGRPPRW